MDIARISAVVTGGAGGLGAATARLITESGGRVAIMDLESSDGKAVADSLGERACFFPADVRDPESVAATFDAIAGRFGEIRLAVLAAGVPGNTRIFRADGSLHDLGRFTEILKTNLIGLFDTVRHSARLMVANESDGDGGRGLIVTVGSIAAFDGQVGNSGYGASKGGVVAMTLPLARELSEYGVRVVTVCPGSFDTNMVAAVPADMRRRITANTPFPKRFGHPSEFALFVRAIAENPMLNGETVRLDGGQRMPSSY
jgi:3-hydroxyacyl-CoA dehydrogenase / 3-hydroxy-2-methylbutyryl-CoA dehydrogenase